MKNFFLVILFLIGLGSISAQSYVKYSLNLPDRNYRNQVNSDSIKILAVMVDFQEDRYDGTTGTGKFGSHYTKAYGDTILDPLPHNAQYFADHLEFTKNYFNKVSKGKVLIQYHVLPDVITVSKTMRDYVPGYNSDDFSPIADFSSEVWNLAGQHNPQFNFSGYNLFIIFHAGISNAIGNGAPLINRNMPSLYLGLESLKQIYGNQFNGFPIGNNNYRIKNTIIMPETESREATTIDNSVLLYEFSINGLLVGNIASYLGLPDLFNTETSKSAIGRFGLMDPQALLANSGMFPPEPSPWEKIFLGWENPVVINPADKKISIASRLSASAGDTTLVKIPISSTEYFLIENRNQDSKKDNLKITYKQNGIVRTKLIEADTSGIFIAERKSVNGIPGGVVLDVDEFDAALPGNGIVIWHIDEKVISGKMQINKINADPDRRGVSVVEADGIRDIGETFYSLFDELIGDGSKEDFWFKGNKSRLYKNRFGSDTKPSSRTNDGSNSLITLENFSDLSDKISFNLIFGSDNLVLVYNVPIPVMNNLSGLSSFQAGNKFSVYLLNGSDLHQTDIYNGVTRTFPDFSAFQPAVYNDGNNQYAAGAKGNRLNLYTTINGNTEYSYHDFNSPITTPPLIIKSSGIVKILFGTSDGKVIRINLNEFISSNHSHGINTFQIDNKPILQLSADENYFSAVTENIFGYSGSGIVSINKKIKQLALTKSADGVYQNIILCEDSEVKVIEEGIITGSFYLPVNGISGFSLADLFGDGNNYLLFNIGAKLYAVNFNGSVAEGFPIVLNTNSTFAGVPLALDLGNDGDVDLFSFTESGDLYGFNASKGKLLPSYPVTLGSGAFVIPALIKEELPAAGPVAKYKPLLPLADKSGNLKIFSLSGIVGKEFWTNRFGNSANTSFTEKAGLENKSEEFFPVEKAYNWPNPVYGSDTFIRYYVSEDSDVNIKIFDIAGDLAAELSDKARGGLDNETKWDVSRIQSGVYFARIEVKGISGKSSSKLIKIAVIK